MYESISKKHGSVFRPACLTLLAFSLALSAAAREPSFIHLCEVSPAMIKPGESCEVLAVFDGTGVIMPGNIKIVSNKKMKLNPRKTTKYELLLKSGAGKESCAYRFTIKVVEEFKGKLTQVGRLSKGFSNPSIVMKDGKVIFADHVRCEHFDIGKGVFDKVSTVGSFGGYSQVFLSDGRLLIAAMPDAMLHDPVMDKTISYVGNRYFYCDFNRSVTTLMDGSILFLGGKMGYSTSSKAWIYNPCNGLFNELNSKLILSRVNHSVVVLQDGKVLITGGVNGSEIPVPLRDASDGPSGPNPCGSYSKSVQAEIFDPQTGTFTRVGDMACARSHHQATLLPDGKVLITGGSDAKDNMECAELFDPNIGMFSVVGETLRRSRHRATLLPSGQVLLSGGNIEENGSRPIEGLELFDPATRESIPAGNLKSARWDHGASLLPDGRVLLAGGMQRKKDSSVYSLDFEIFDPMGAKELPFITAGPQGLKVKEGESAIFKVQAKGKSLCYQWLRNGVAVPGANSDTCRIPNVSSAHNGAQFSVQVSSAGASIQSRAASLAVEAKPLPMPSIAFFKSEKPMIFSGGNTLLKWDVSNACRVTLSPGSDVHFNSPELVCPETDTVYTLKAVNIAGDLASENTLVRVADFKAEPEKITFGQPTHLKFTFSAGRGFLFPYVGEVENGAQIKVKPKCTTTYTFTVQQEDGRVISKQIQLNPSGKVKTWYGKPVALKNGKVLIYGSRNAELYDTATLKCVPIKAPLKERQNETAILLDNGRVLIAGGELGGAASASAEIYDPVACKFIEAGNMIEKRIDPVSCLLNDGRALVLGGHNNEVHHDNAEIFDAKLGEFKRAGETVCLGQIVDAVTLKNGKVFVVGNTENGYGAEIYDPDTEKFNVIGYIGLESPGMATLLSDGKVMIGENGKYAIYNPENNEFRPVEGPGSYTHWLLPNGKVFLPDDKSNIFDPAKCTFSEVAYFTNDRGKKANMTLLPDGRLLVAKAYETVIFDPMDPNPGGVDNVEK